MKTIAHVGHTGTQNDFLRLMEVFKWIGETPEKQEFIDLSKGRDFLAETKEYSVVVLHFIFRGGGLANYAPKEKELKISPLSSWSNWRKRLVESKANLIFAYGGIAEVGGTFLCNLNGYKVHKVRTEDTAQAFSDRQDQQAGLWVFEKETK